MALPVPSRKSKAKSLALESELAHERGTLLAQIEEVEAELHAARPRP